MTNNELLKAFKTALYFEEAERIMEGGISVPLKESHMFEAFKCGVVFAEAQNTIHNKDYAAALEVFYDLFGVWLEERLGLQG